VKFFSANITNINFGSDPITRVYRGTKLLWEPTAGEVLTDRLRIELSASGATFQVADLGLHVDGVSVDVLGSAIEDVSYAGNVSTCALTPTRTYCTDSGTDTNDRVWDNSKWTAASAYNDGGLLHEASGTGPYNMTIFVHFNGVIALNKARLCLARPAASGTRSFPAVVFKDADGTVLTPDSAPTSVGDTLVTADPVTDFYTPYEWTF